MQNVYCSLQGLCDPALSHSAGAALPLGLCAVFHFLKFAPSPFRVCPGLVRILSVARDRNPIQTGLSPKECIDSCDGKAPEKVGMKSGRLIPIGCLWSLLYYLHSQSLPKGCEDSACILSSHPSGKSGTFTCSQWL